MEITSYCKSSIHSVGVAFAACTSSGKVITHAEIPPKSIWVNCPAFELVENKWFGYDGNLIIRFSKDRENDWRIKTAREMVESGDLDPVVLYRKSENAAFLINLDLNEFLYHLRTLSQSPDEDYTSLFRKFKDAMGAEMFKKSSVVDGSKT